MQQSTIILPEHGYRNVYLSPMMTGVVLCGGASSRMGKDKGLLTEGNLTWAGLAAQKFSALRLPVVVSINKKQGQAYAPVFPNSQLLVDNENLRVQGPLAGLLSVHLQRPTEDLFVLACDMKDMTTSLLHQLRKAYQQRPGKACVYQTGEKRQPLCGIYPAVGLSRICELLAGGSLKQFSLMNVLDIVNARSLNAEENDLPAFNNYNEPADLS